ncbi:MAG: outer membrane protein assembly factor BamD [Pseudomonadota bacterium]
MTGQLLTRIAAFALIGAIVSGCSWFESDEVPIEDRSAREIYDTAQALLDDGEPIPAAKMFDEVERLYPFSQLAKRAIIQSAFSSYTANDYPAARASANRYLDLYPSDIDSPYAQYLIALTYYDNIVDVGRDQIGTESALRELKEVVRRYPESDYARDSRLKIDLTHNHLAGKEMDVGRYYLKRGHFVAAINRFKVVLDEYQTTSHAPEALHRIVEANLAMGVAREAQIAAAVLAENFPGSEWYAASYALLTDRDLRPEKADDGFFSSIYRRVILGDWL